MLRDFDAHALISAVIEHEAGARLACDFERFANAMTDEVLTGASRDSLLLVLIEMNKNEDGLFTEEVLTEVAGHIDLLSDD